MIIELKIANFLSFKEETVFSMEPSSRKEFVENKFIIDASTYKGELLKSAFICGANASGKSNFLKALSTLRGIILSEPHRSPTEAISEYIPFITQKDKPTRFEILFLIDNIKYKYVIEYNNQRIIKESLDYSPKCKSANIFYIDRENENNNKFPEETKKQQDVYELCLPNNVYLSMASQSNVQIAHIVFDWFKYKIKYICAPEIQISDIFSSKDVLDYLTNEGTKKKIITNLNKADVGITELISETDEHKKISEQVVINTISKNKDLWSPKSTKTGDIDENFKAFYAQMQQIASIKARHQFVNKFGKEEYGDFELFGAYESDGTKKFAYLSMLFDKAISNNQILIIDELETSLHPELLFFLTDLINNANNNGCQLIFTTQNYLLLEREKSHFRTDQMWLTDKNSKTGASDLYSIADFKDNRSDSDIFKRYMNRKFGAYPNVLK